MDKFSTLFHHTPMHSWHALLWELLKIHSSEVSFVVLLHVFFKKKKMHKLLLGWTELFHWPKAPTVVWIRGYLLFSKDIANILMTHTALNLARWLNNQFNKSTDYQKETYTKTCSCSWKLIVFAWNLETLFLQKVRSWKKTHTLKHIWQHQLVFTILSSTHYPDWFVNLMIGDYLAWFEKHLLR